MKLLEPKKLLFLLPRWLRFKIFNIKTLKLYKTKTGNYYLPFFAFRDVVRNTIIENEIFDHDVYEISKKFIKENFKFFGAPTAMIITIDKSFSKNGWGHVGMFLQNLWLLAVNEGLGMCLQESWSIYPQTVRSVIKHPNNEIVWCGIALGYPNSDHPINNYKTSREPIDSFVKFVD